MSVFNEEIPEELALRGGAYVRLVREARDIQRYSETATGPSFSLLEISEEYWTFEVDGPVGSKFEGRKWRFSFTFLHDYPLSAPLIKFLDETVEGTGFMKNSPILLDLTAIPPVRLRLLQILQSLQNLMASKKKENDSGSENKGNDEIAPDHHDSSSGPEAKQEETYQTKTRKRAATTSTKQAPSKKKNTTSKKNELTDEQIERKIKDAQDKVDRQKVIYESAKAELDSALALQQKKREEELEKVSKEIQELEKRRKGLEETLNGI